VKVIPGIIRPPPCVQSRTPRCLPDRRVSSSPKVADKARPQVGSVSVSPHPRLSPGLARLVRDRRAGLAVAATVEWPQIARAILASDRGRTVRPVRSCAHTWHISLRRKRQRGRYRLAGSCARCRSRDSSDPSKAAAGRGSAGGCGSRGCAGSRSAPAAFTGAICAHASTGRGFGFPANNPPKRAVSRLVGTVAPRLGEQLCCLVNAPDSLGKC
jgi:hypothetical protein